MTDKEASRALEQSGFCLATVNVEQLTSKCIRTLVITKQFTVENNNYLNEYLL